MNTEKMTPLHAVPNPVGIGGVTFLDQTMSSVEIAELTGKDHYHVCRDIRETLQAAGINVSIFGDTYSEGLNKGKVKQYNLPRRECDLVISGYSVPYRLKIIDRWHELEGANKMPTTFSEALFLAGTIQKEKEALEAQMILDAPKVKYANHIFAQNKAMNVSAYAKLVSEYEHIIVGPNKLMEYFREAKYLMSGRDETEKNLPYQEFVKKGLFRVTQVETPVGMRNVTQVTGMGQIDLLPGIVKYFTK